MKFIIAILLISVNSWAGWVSSGGGLFRDAMNPWFVRNTTDVKYCIRVDKASVSASETDISTAIAEGISYWISEFAKVQGAPAIGFFNLGTQKFSEVACSDPDVSIEFLFGVGTLNPKQFAHLVDPTKYVGVTVRTDYDEVNLKGKGFVFFSSDMGPSAYDNPGSLISQAWTHSKILKYAILHELGHVFGIPHTGSGLMAEVFLNQILDKSLVGIYEKAPIESFMHPNERVVSCMFMLPSLKDFFEGDPKHKCIEVQKVEGAPWKVYSREDETAVPVEVGEIRAIQSDILSYQSKPVSILQITGAQTVFSAKETAFRSFLVGPAASQFQGKGTYVSKKSSIPKSILMTVGPSYLSLTGSVGTKLENVFIYNSPIGALLNISPTP
jgi:hypothetical protein